MDIKFGVCLIRMFVLKILKSTKVKINKRLTNSNILGLEKESYFNCLKVSGIKIGASFLTIILRLLITYFKLEGCLAYGTIRPNRKGLPKLADDI